MLPNGDVVVAALDNCGGDRDGKGGGDSNGMEG